MPVTHSLLCLATAALAALVTLPGCASNDEDGDEASSTTTSALQAQTQVGLTDGVLDVEGPVAPTAEAAAQAVADQGLRGIQPEGCAKKTRSNNVVTVALDGCTGPFGKVAIVGSLVATFTNPSVDVIHVEIAAGEGTTANGQPLTYAAGADVRYDGSMRFVTYHGSSSGTTKRGKAFSRTTDLAIVADAATHCATMDGVSKGAIGKYDVDLAIEGFKGCRDACPSSGTARATVTGPLVDATVAVTFDGSTTARAKVDGRRRSRTVDVALDCAAAESE